MVKLIIMAIFAYLAWKAWGVVAGSRPPERLGARASGRLNGKGPVRQLVHDPQCNTYIPEETAERISLGGKMVYFCSPDCREAYLKKSQGEKG